jgi:hypothetical protein
MTVTAHPVALVITSSTSVPIHDRSTFAALSATPFLITAGKVQPTAPLHRKWATSCATTSLTAAGVDRRGVGMRCRLVINRPVVTSTGAALMPLPPMSTPRAIGPGGGNSEPLMAQMVARILAAAQSNDRTRATSMSKAGAFMPPWGTMTSA